MLWKHPVSTRLLQCCNQSCRSQMFGVPTILNSYLTFGLAESTNPFYSVEPRRPYFNCVLVGNKETFKFSNNNVQSRVSLSTSACQNKIMDTIRRKINELYSDKTKTAFGAFLTYEKCADEVDYPSLFKCFNLPDTFHSWFLVLQIHVWMCALIMVTERNGRIFRNKLVDSMYTDLETRLEQLKELNATDRKTYINAANEQFNASLYSYDEGINGDDTVLAAAVWRTMYNFRLVDPRDLEKVVLYIRKQVKHLDTLNIEEILFRGKVTFLPLDAIFKDSALE